jgi:Uma2 family endonuclease
VEEALMNVLSNLHMDKAEFVAWMQANEGRYELAGGRIVMLPGASKAHGRIVTGLVIALSSAFDRQQWDVISEFGLDAGPQTLRYPDVVVEPATGGNKDYTTTAPVLLAEVLSPSTAELDLGDKAAEYLQISSLLAYVVLSQDEPKAWLWTRAQGAFTGGPEVLSGSDAIIRVPTLQLALPLSSIYAGVL